MFKRASIAAARTLFFVGACALGAAAQTSWIQQAPTALPGLLGALAMTYDEANQVVVLFGGFTPSSYSNETWTYDGATWTRRMPPVSPPARAAATMCYDAPTQRVIMFGGFDGMHYLGDTWVWDGASSTWTPNTATPSPVSVTGPMSFPDPLNGHVDLFGGYNGMFYQLTTWQWSGTSWTQLHPATSPYARSAGVAVLDRPNANVVLFGGLGSVNPNNTWLWDGTNWQQQFPATQPALRYDSAGAFEPNLGHPILFGGGSGGVDQQDTWEWTGTNWVQIPTVGMPSPRESFGLAYATNIGHVVLFGGDDNGSPLFNDTWWLSVPPPCCQGYCFGDGSGAACPCANNSTPGNGEGCLNSLGTGGKLSSSGIASISTDTLVLSGSHMPDSSALYFQGTTQIAVTFGDGLRCVGGSITRLATKTNVSGASQFPAGGDPHISMKGAVTTPGTRSYQCWYRNAAAFCTASTFNLTNGVSVAWGS